jgi:hypothetical protein
MPYSNYCSDDNMTTITYSRYHRKWAICRWVALMFIASLLISILTTPVLAEDGEAPTITLISPSDGELISDTSITVRWSGECITPSLLDHYEIRIDASSWLNVQDATEYVTPSLSEGIHTVIVKIFDSDGRNDSVGHSFVIDSNAPSLSITYPAEGSIHSVNNFTMEWVANDTGTGISSYSIGIDGEPTLVGSGMLYYDLPSLSDGRHQLIVTAMDKIGNMVTRSVTVTIDTTSPELTIIYPEDHSYHLGESVEIEWSAYDAVSEVNGFFIKVDDGVWIDVASSTTYRFTSLDRDPHVITVRCVDQAGNAVSSTVTVTMNIDEPLVRIVNPVSGSIIEGSSVRLGWASILGTLDLDHYEISVDGQGWYSAGKYLQMTVEGLDEGQHTISVKVCCEGGMTAVDTVTVFIDNTVPEVSFDELDGTILSDSKITISWTSQLDHIQYSLCIDNGTWVDLGSATSFQPYDLSDGHHSVDLTATYVTGTSTRIRAEFRIDSYAPTLVVTSPIDKMFDTNQGIAITWGAVDEGISPTGVDHYMISVDGGQWVGMGMSTTFILNLTADGWHTVVIQSYDVAGNMAEASIDIYVDTSRPDVWITGPAEDDMTSEPNATLVWNSNDATGTVITSSLRIDKGPIIDLDLSGGRHVFSMLADGAHTVTVTVRDMVGNHRTATVNFTVDTTVPELVIISPTDGAHTNDNGITFTWTASDAIGIDHYMVSTSGTWEYYEDATPIVMANLPDGSYSMGVIAYDIAGNAAMTMVEVVIDTQAPSVLSFGPTGGGSVLSRMPTVEFDEVMGNVSMSITVSGGGTDVLYFINVTEATAEFALMPSANYSISIVGTDAAGNPIGQMEWTFVTRSTGAPSMVQNLTADTGDSSITLSWKAPREDNGFLLTYYRVYRAGDDGEKLLATLGADVLTFTDDTAEGGEDYTYSIVAVNVWGSSEPAYLRGISLNDDGWQIIYWSFPIAILAVVIIWFLWRRKHRAGLPDAVQGIMAEPVPVKVAVDMPTKIVLVEPEVAKIDFRKMDDEELASLEHNTYLRRRLAELNRSFKAGEMANEAYRIASYQIMNELMDRNRAAFSRIRGR